MKYKLVLLLFLIFLLAETVFSYHNALPVDGLLTIGFPFQYLNYSYESASFAGSIHVRALVADVGIAAFAAFCSAYVITRLRRKQKSGS